MNPKTKKSSLIFWIIIGLFFGTLVGGFFPEMGKKFGILGEVFMNLLKMIVIPLVITSLISGITALGDIRKVGVIGRRSILFYMSTTAISVLIGLVLVNIIKPGKAISIDSKISLSTQNHVEEKMDKSLSDAIKEVILGDTASGKEGLIPKNIFNAMVNMDILPIIFFSLLVGFALSTLGGKAQGFINSINVLNDAIMKIIHWIILAAPIGIFGLISDRIGRSGGFVGFYPELTSVANFFMTVFLGLLIHSIVVLPLFLKFFGKKNPIKYFKGMRLAILNAFSTASSSATIPLTMSCVEQNNQISKRTSSFVIPLGATINMDGTALYESVAALFIAQLYGIDLSLIQQCIVFLTATLAAIGAAGIPEAGLVTMVIVLRAVNLPTEGIALLLTIDWLLDRFRTATNVWGDSIGAGVVESLGANDIYKPKSKKKIFFLFKPFLK